MWYSVFIAVICGAVSGGAMFALENKIYDLLSLTPAARLASSPYFRARSVDPLPQALITMSSRGLQFRV